MEWVRGLLGMVARTLSFLPSLSQIRKLTKTLTQGVSESMGARWSIRVKGNGVFIGGKKL